MHVAVLDLGTNTFQLLIAEVMNGWVERKHLEEQWVNLADEGIETIGVNALQRAALILQEYQKTITQFKCNVNVAIGTAAFRKASNREQLKSLVKQILGVEVTIISGEDEARYIYRGVTQALRTAHILREDDLFLVMDIGGGSTEFIIGSIHEILSKHSFPIGASVMRNKYSRDKELTISAIEQLKFNVISHLGEVAKLCKKYQVHAVVGSAGAFDTYTYILQKGHIDLATPVNILNKENLLTLIHTFYLTPEDERRKLMGEKGFRAPMITSAGAITEAVLNACEIDHIYHSAYSAKEGVLYTLFNSLFS